MAVHAFQHFLEMLVQLLCRFLVIESVGKFNIPIFLERDPVFRIGPVFGSQPKIDSMLGHHFQRPTRCETGGVIHEHRRHRFADHLNVSNRMFVIFPAPIEIVDGQRLLKLGRVDRFG